MDRLAPALFSPIGVIVAALIAALFSFIGLVLAKEAKTSEFRKAWIDGLRDDLAKYVASVMLLSPTAQVRADDPTTTAAADLDAMRPIFDAAITAQTSIRLRINPAEKDRDFAALNNNLLQCIEGIQTHVNAGEYDKALSEARGLHMLANPVLKREWARVKAGEPAYRRAKVAAAIVVLASVALIGLALAMSLRAKDSWTPRSFSTGRPLPAFSTGSYASSDTLRDAVCAIRMDFAAEKVTSAIVVGRHDVRELLPSVLRQSSSNEALALQRARVVADLLTSASACVAPPLQSALPLSVGPRLDTGSLRNAKGAAAELVTAPDRVTSVFGIRGAASAP